MKRPSPIGAVTIITAIMVLCMTVFAALAYSSGMAEYRLSRNGADAVDAYYAADRAAAELVADVLGGGEPSFEGEYEFDGSTLTAEISAGERQTLQIEVKIDDGRAEILSWRTVADTGDEEVLFFD